MDKIYRSNLIFAADKEYEQEPDSISSPELKEIATQLQFIQQTREQRRDEKLREGDNEKTGPSDSDSQDIDIVELDISFRTYNVLRRARN